MLFAGLAIALVGGCAAQASAGGSSLAERLLALDPGARLGGNTQVVTAQGAQVAGVPGRPNFIIGLNDGQLIVGGNGDDQLGVRGDRSVIDGGPGADLINGGKENDVIKGGPGPDLILGGDEGDRINGGPGADLIYGGADRDQIKGGPGKDTVIKGNPPQRLLGRGDPDPPSTVTGSGTNDDPFTAPCDDPGLVDCVINAFPSRQLAGLWANEYVPAYRCPADHPYLHNGIYRPFGTSLPNGVEVAGLGPIGVSIAGPSYNPVSTPNGGSLKQATGTLTGGANSSATSWSGSFNNYRVILHCTSDPSRAFYF